MDTNLILRKATLAAKASDKVQARALLKEVIQQEPRNEAAWLLYAEVAEAEEHSIFCLLKVLELNPSNETAKSGLNALRHETSSVISSQQDPQGHRKQLATWAMFATLVCLTLAVGATLIWQVISTATSQPNGNSTRASSGNVSATQQAGGEQQALRSLVWVAVPAGDPQTTRDLSSGSGSLLDARGYVLTNFHIVGDLNTGRFYNNAGWVGIGINWNNASDVPDTFYRCEIVKADIDIDLVLIRVVALGNGDPLPTFPFMPVGNSDDLQIGDPIAVIGFPGLGGGTPTFTRGTVSGFLVDELLNLHRGWIKTDAEVNPGNSGGMAINSKGELIGVPTWASFSMTGKISVLRPINSARSFIEAIP